MSWLGSLAARRLARRLAIAAAIAAVIYLIVRATHLASVPFLLLLGLAFAVIGTQVALEAVRLPKVVTPLLRDSEPTMFGAPDRPFIRARHWEERLDLVRGDAEHFTTVVLPELAELTDERLLMVHGITRATNPDAARTLLGPRLSAFLERTDRSKPPSRSELTAIVTDLESL